MHAGTKIESLRVGSRKGRIEVIMNKTNAASQGSDDARWGELEVAIPE